MGNAAHRIENQMAEIGRAGLTSSQTARYTRDLLDSLGKIATQQRQDMLARLLEVAAIEARRIVETDPAA